MKILKDINYYSNQKLDIYYPEQKAFKTIIYFHGGGIVSGSKDDDLCVDLMKHLVNKGFMMVNVNYSLYPNTKFPQFLKECAQSVKYVFEHADELGVDRDKIYISGQSAGAYITMMLALNKEYLKEVGLDTKDIKGFISDSGQMSDHFNVQHYENGVDPWIQRISELSPLYFVQKDSYIPSILLIYYSDDMLNRKEQNIMLYNLVKFYQPEADISQIELKGNHVDGSIKLDMDGEYPYVKVLINWLKNR